MHIDAATLREIHLPLVRPFETSTGRSTARRVLLVELQSAGHTGWAECVAPGEPSYSPETVETAWHVLTSFVLDDLPGQEVESAAELMAPFEWIRGHRMALAAVEMAGWDLRGKVEKKSLRELLGLDSHPVPTGISIGLQADDDDLHQRVSEALDVGYARIKLKIRPGRDVDMLRGVRSRFPDVPLMVDANSAYSLADAPLLEELDALDLLMIEQPLGHEDLADHAELQTRLATPICLDESIRSTGDARLALDLGSGRILNLKPGRVGGLASSRSIHDLWTTHPDTTGAWVGGMLETGIGRAFNVAIAGCPGFTLAGDLSASRRYWARDIVTPEWTVHDGTIAPVDGPGIGVVPDTARIDALTTRLLRVEV